MFCLFLWLCESPCCRIPLRSAEREGDMALTRQEYEDLLTRSDAGEICFMFDAAQCKDFLLKLNNAEALSSTGNSLRFESRVVRTIVYFLEPVSLLMSMVGGFLWLRWFGLLVAPGVFIFWSLLKSVSSGGRQRLLGPLLTFALGIFLAFAFRNHGVGFIIFAVSLSSLYLAEKMLYALPVLFFSFLTRSNYDFVRVVYEQPVDGFNREMGIPLMWHVETPGGSLPKPSVKLPSHLFLTVYGWMNKECRVKAFGGDKDRERRASELSSPTPTLQTDLDPDEALPELPLQEKAEEAHSSFRILMEALQ